MGRAAPPPQETKTSTATYLLGKYLRMKNVTVCWTAAGVRLFICMFVHLFLHIFSTINYVERSQTAGHLHCEDQ